MAADAWVVHDDFKLYLGNGSIDLDGDTFKMILCQSTSNVATTSVGTYTAVTDEVANGNGYTTGGETMTTLAYAAGSPVTTMYWDADNVVWTASGGSITARYAAIYDDTVATSPGADTLVCHSLLDNSPADVTATDGNTFTVAINASGIFSLA